MPYALWLFVFSAVPLLITAFLAFTNRDNAFDLSGICGTLDFSGVFLRSFLFALCSSVICLLIAYPFAYMITKLNKNTQNILITLTILPMWMNFLLRTYSWMTILESNGILARIFSFIGLRHFNILNTSTAVILGMVYNFFPYMVIPLYTSLSGISESSIEAAWDLGASKTEIFFKVILLESFPGFFSGITMVFAPSFSTFVISKMLGGRGNVMIGEVIEMCFLGNSYNPHLGSAIAFVLMLFITVCTAFINCLGKKDS
jgi:spermidine/putrescine transport system permease protein